LVTVTTSGSSGILFRVLSGFTIPDVYYVWLYSVQSARVNKYKIANTLSLTNTPYRFTRDSDRWVPCSDYCWVVVRD
jgi:hypothetical protein